MTRLRIHALAACLGAIMLTGCAQTPAASVDELADNVYLFTHNIHRSLFIVTDDGILVTDPQTAEAAPRYLEEVRKISDAPIRYLVYSHHHNDHASGGAVFGDEVTTVGHENVRNHLGDEGMQDVQPPDMTFTDEMALFLGDLEVRLLYPGHSETDSNIILYLPARNMAFMVDTMLVRAVPWQNMASGDLNGWIAALETLHGMDFDTFVPGHGPLGTKDDIQALIDYMTTLKDEVARRIDEGQALEEIQNSLELPQYAEWDRYDEHFALNIEGVHRELTEQRQ